jgi:hypothetical protein
MVAREAEAASWTQRRQMYAAGGPPAAVKRPDPNMWTVPSVGYSPSPAPPPPPPHAMQHFVRPLHVWGHPSMDSPRMPMWPRHPIAPRPPMPSWAPPPPPSDPAFWHHPYMRPAYMPTHGTPCMAMPMAPAPVSNFSLVISDYLLAVKAVYPSKWWYVIALSMGSTTTDELDNFAVPEIPCSGCSSRCYAVSSSGLYAPLPPSTGEQEPTRFAASTTSTASECRLHLSWQIFSCYHGPSSFD